DEYYAGITEQMGAEYAEGMRALFTTPVILMWSVLIFVLGVIGGWLGTRAFRKHFQRAGLAR
ncbi:MAG: MptD family putative ECF transporter S component, partial [Actinomycetaceae bacterium]|nr:MptD family putative ECF transporter S component [Actinomycetaceae bacterium]